ncbi:hypothetical protein [Chengkuizengella axinellae]|uniref:DUF4309 domain-containing protein n=1 Tax=Chengkuizengella axinellae TaxID=3064388 RepID=A0ABT9IXA1_9BACL|nr:hypothetical protein [Chengkuizengella sp. 2205SS18-9]MDP5273942.1 hypothetical protein [Chengkuizengella sp. 2205SS18-9]
MKQPLLKTLCAVALGSLILYGCSSEEAVQEISVVEEQDTLTAVEETLEVESIQAEELESPEVSIEIEQNEEEPPEETSNTTFENDIDTIQSSLQIGLSKEDITEMLGEQYSEFVSPLDDIIMWKYDLLTSSDYIYDAESQSDAIDFEGFMNGTIGAQLFVEWSYDEFTNHYVMYYVCGDEGEICEFRVWDDGSITKSQIN